MPNTLGQKCLNQRDLGPGSSNTIIGKFIISLLIGQNRKHKKGFKQKNGGNYLIS